MTDVLPDVVITGQRAVGQTSTGFIFPSFSIDGGGTGPSDPNVPSIEPDEGLSDQDVQCADPIGNIEWNLDAAAAIALREFLARGISEDGNDGTYLTRERHAYMYRRAGGSIYFGPLAEGGIDGVTPNQTGQTPDELIGAVHNHPGGSLQPTPPDWAGHDILSAWIGQYAGQARQSQYRIYVIAMDQSYNPPRLGIRMYNHASPRTAEDDGKPVNPDGQPCSGTTIAPPAPPAP